MSKRKVKTDLNIDLDKAMRRIAWERSVSEMRDGRKNRAVTFTDRRKEANKKACRKKVDW